MTCDCYKVGGPFIAEDPNCYEHGYAAQKNESPRKSKLSINFLGLWKAAMMKELEKQQLKP